MVQDKPITTSDCIQLEYVSQSAQNPNVSKTADTPSNKRIECGHNVAPTHVNTTTDSNSDVFNIQLNCNINQALDLNSWDGEFRAISLHGSMKHLGSDIKNIKESLSRMEKYILSKGIDSSKANNIKDFEGLGKAAWRFITALYTSQWDNLSVDSTNRFFRNNIKLKFSPQVVKEATKSKNSNILHFLYVSFFSSPIPAKSAKKINEVSKYFKKQQPTNYRQKSYTQVLAK